MARVVYSIVIQQHNGATEPIPSQSNNYIEWQPAAASPHHYQKPAP
ncbi:unnamed protein product, partial [Anisakis simplex]|uniref:Uncharacterized protein n=1 Tax=Anisakis simplex TaxID=6269 RepID=A0A0M3J5G3_ANISI